MKRYHRLFTFVLLLGVSAWAGNINGKVNGIPKPKALPGAFPPPPTPAVVWAVPIPAKAVQANGKTYVVDQQWTQFKPGVLVIPVGATVEFKNNDTVKHNIKWDSIGGNRALAKNLGTHAPGQNVSYKFTHPGAVHLQCTLHPGMSAWIYVVPTNYSAVTKTSGEYKLSNLPNGRYKVSVWHPGRAVQTHVVTVGANTKVDFKL